MAPQALAGGLAVSTLAALWQGAALVLLVLATLRLFPGLSASRRSAVWVAALALLAGMQFCALFGVLHPGVLLPKRGQEAAYVLDARWSLTLAGVSLFLSVFGAVRLFETLIRVRDIRRRATPLAGIASTVPVLESDEVTRPCVVGCVRPAILFPRGLAAQLSETELEQILLHENAHIRRGDAWINLAQKLALVLFPLNPALFFAERQLSLEREMACDDHVMQRTGTRKSYAACLARLAEHRLLGQGAAVLVGAWGRRPELVRRIERILRGAPAELGGWQARVAASTVMIATVAGGAALTRSPELVSFRPGPAEVAQTSSAPVALLPVASGGYGHVAMVKAVLPTTVKPVEHPRHLRVKTRHMPKRPGVLMASAPAMPASPYVVQQISWQQGALIETGTTQPGAMPAVVYLVPTSRGWLVIQI